MTTARYRLAVLVVLLVAAQHLFFNRIELLGVHPDLLLMLAVVAGITGGPERGAAAGFAAGLVTDVFLATPVGLSALAYTIAAAAAGAASRGTTELPWTTGALTFAASAAAIGVFVIAGGVTADTSVSVGRAATVALVVGAVNGLFAPLAAPLLRSAWQRRQPAW